MPESLEDFLRRVLQPPPEPKSPVSPAREPRPQRESAELAEVIEAEAAEAPIPELPFGLAESEGRRLHGEDAHARHDRLEADLRQGLERSLGRLPEAPETVGEKAEGRSLAEEIVDLLHAPGGLRKAFALGEILKSPEERW